MASPQQPIGVFDSGYGGLTVLRALVDRLPAYDYLYLGDNARTPYGNRSFEAVYRFTLQGVRYLFGQGCALVILACNTASAKALRSIQQRDLPGIDPTRRVLGVIRPTTEVAGLHSPRGHVGIMATRGTVDSDSYPIEIGHFFPGVRVYQQACPMWVPLVENREADSAGADFFVARDLGRLLAQSPEIDLIVLGCTHYPLLEPLIRRHLPPGVALLSQGGLVAESLASYLQRHPEMATRCSRGGGRAFLTTDDPALFERQGEVFFGEPVKARQVALAP